MSTHYVSDGFGNVRNFGGQKFEDYTVGNVRASWTSADEQWEVAFFGRNIWDERYKNSIRSNETFCGCNHDSYGKPQWFGGQVRYNF